MEYDATAQWAWEYATHSRRIYTEEKANVVAAVVGDKVYLIPCRAGYFAP